MIDQTEALRHFVRLARRGAAPAASGGEGSAARLAAAILENAPRLDDQALEGALLFAVVSKRCMWDAQELLEAPAAAASGVSIGPAFCCPHCGGITMERRVVGEHHEPGRFVSACRSCGRQIGGEA